eukprot:9472318-Ditylum_brightwellii.AAC.2
MSPVQNLSRHLCVLLTMVSLWPFPSGAKMIKLNRITRQWKHSVMPPYWMSDHNIDGDGTH